mmetsp:Transcript_94373/g.281651  ORF Transcript_94373/g.281651 Transcript_94373/m.281651 type:complete len:117 (+) Transcript_94373:81-431(+)|eukprot:CAMPEP_0175266656 /NCGR_PEP_ID=MMETSP0093-20121207/43446_1 /TAXON_ID=311494 /ORGANISM="Alexandrium monilatum, Strain CCMP3105" /LENGTH=116 /DNA_ID=CAMNT_0016561269 /DNA_START=63 /DNA_END=413 /DNA_ORIENTATION=-
MSSWKHTFKAHRIAANMGNTAENFIYHREQQSFPTAMPRPSPKKGSPRASGVKAQLQRLRGKAFSVAGARQSSLGTYIGFGLPIAGAAIFYMFVFASQSDQMQTQQLLKSTAPAEV